MHPNRPLPYSAPGATAAAHAAAALAAERLRTAPAQALGAAAAGLPSQPRARGVVPACSTPALALPEAPDGAGFITLLSALRASGGTAPSEFVNGLLQEHQFGSAAGLAELVETGRVFGFRWRAALWIPMFQFGADDMAPKPGAQQVREELPSGWSAWAVASWFAAPNSELGGHSAAAMLDTELDAVLRAARMVALADPFRALDVHPAHHAIAACV
jgi:Protein of unknown function (DUF2384)